MMIKTALTALLFWAAVQAPVQAADIDLSDLDKAVRSSGSKSIMFRRGGGEAEEARMQAEAEAEAREKAEQEAKVKQEQAVFRPYNLFGRGLKIAATINGEMISNKDLQERANLFALTTGININDKNKKMVSDKVLQNTVDEKIKIQEAEKQGIHVSDKEIKEAYRNFEKSNGVPAGKFANVLKEYQVSRDVFMTQIKANLLWNKLVANRMGRGADVSEREVKDEYARIKKDMNTPKYMVSEIVIKRKDGEHIGELVEILQKDPRFELYAAQFSQSASAPSGGKLGWVTEGQLPPELEKHIKNLSSGEVSDPILYNGDYYIFKVEKKFDPDKDRMPLPSNEEVKNMLQNQKNERYAEERMQELRQRAVIELKE